MKKIVFKFGLLAGVILVAKIFVMMAIKGDSADFERGASAGPIFLIGAFSMIFFGIREYRDKISDGIISFNMAFRAGILITILASFCYVIGWMINIYFIDPAFFEQYTTFYTEKIQSGGKSPEDIAKEIAAFKTSMAGYNNPAVIAMHTFLEVFPVGLIITIMCSMLMKRSSNAASTT